MSGLKNLGQTIDVHENIMVIGAPGDESQGKGYAHVYERASQNAPWVYKTQLQAKEFEHSDNFGWSISVCGNTIVGKYSLSVSCSF